MTDKAPNPYVGPVPFVRGDERGFYGRDGDLRRLAILFIAQRIVLLYSPSGAGKTSLIHARLIPALEMEDFEVLPVIRLNRRPANGSAGSNPFLHSIVYALEEDSHNGEMPGSFGDYWRQRRAAMGDKPTVLIFDQFEEILTIDPHDQQQKLDFFDQVGAVLQEDDNLWALFAIREDYLAELDPFRHLLPGKLNQSYRLELLNEQQALAAIQKPAAAENVNFSDEAADKLVSQLRRVTVHSRDGQISYGEGPTVEPVQLQVVCQTLWDDLQPEVEDTITAESVAAEGHVDDSLGKFYDTTVARISEDNEVVQRDIRDWFGQKLITEQGLRGQVMGSTDLNLSLDIIDELVDAHLIRAEERRGIQWYELAHDRLVKPVKQNNDEWYNRNLSLLQLRAEYWRKSKDDSSLLRGMDLIEAEEWAKGKELKHHELSFLERSHLEEQALARKEKDRRTKITFGLFSVFSVFMILLATVSFMLFQNAEEASFVAETADTTASELKVKYFNLQIRAEQEASMANAISSRAKTDAKIAQFFQLKAVKSIARSLVAQGQAEFEKKPLLGLALVLEGLDQVSGVEPRTQVQTLADSRERIFQWGRLSNLSDENNGIWISPDGSIMLIDQLGSDDEVLRTEDGQRLSTLSGNISSVEFGPDESTLFFVKYNDAPAELRLIEDGALLVKLSLKVESVNFSPRGSAPIFEVRYKDVPSELRRTVDGELLTALGKNVSFTEFSPDESSSLFAIGYWDAPAEIRRTTDGQLLYELPGQESSVTFSPDETASFFVVGYSDAPGELRRTIDGQILAELPGLLEEVIFSRDEAASFFVINYADAPAELRRTANGQLFDELAGAVDWVTFSPDEEASRFVIDYLDAPGELRRTNDGQLLETFPGKVDWVTFSPDEEASLFVVDYLDTPGELRRTVNGQLLETFPGEVNSVTFSLDESASLFVVGYWDAPSELRRTNDGQVIKVLPGQVDRLSFSPDEAASLFVIDYADAPGELRRTDDGQLLAELAGEVDDVNFSPDEAASFMVIHYGGGQSELWERDKILRLAQLGLNVNKTIFAPGNESLIITYDKNRAYLLDLEWLKAMNGRADELTIDELVTLACEGPLSRGLFDESELEKYGIDEPQACR